MRIPSLSISVGVSTADWNKPKKHYHSYIVKSAEHGDYRVWYFDAYLGPFYFLANNERYP